MNHTHGLPQDSSSATRVSARRAAAGHVVLDHEQLEKRREGSETPPDHPLGVALEDSEQEEEQAGRPFRDGALQSILNDEFSGNYRFEGISNFFSDLKGFVRNVLERDDEEDVDQIDDE